MKFTGKVTEIKFSNPHAWIYLDVTGEDGKVVNWALEMGGANALIRRGWRREDLPAGTVLLIEGWQARNETPTANISTVTFEDGRRLFAGSSNPAAPQTATVVRCETRSAAAASDKRRALRAPPWRW